MNNKDIARKFEKQLMILANYFKELRFSDNITQVEVAEESGLHRNTISNIETSKNFTVLTLLQLCDFYELSASELMSIVDGT